MSSTGSICVTHIHNLRAYLIQQLQVRATLICCLHFDDLREVVEMLGYEVSQHMADSWIASAVQMLLTCSTTSLVDI